jgi:N6-adenosine-specific RNA methylase IME4
MSIADLQRFPLPTMASDSLLFLWRVASMPDEALAVCRAWGFTPKSEIVWVKTTAKPLPSVALGMGRYVRNAHEVCIVASRGKGHTRIQDHRVPSVLFAPRTKHSAKPDAFYDLVERLTWWNEKPVELFARRERAGWNCYGNELGRAHP